MKTLIEALSEIQYNGVFTEVLTDCNCDTEKENQYEESRKVFNRRFQFRPTAIVFCTCTEHVSAVISLTTIYDFDIRVRSGGHDHEGECSGTDTVVIDLSLMNAVTVDEDKKAKIQPGARFKKIIPELNKYNVSIPHGTCGTVGIAGFTFGGGWGPWTRLHGMCCESLVGATIVLGNGQIKYLTKNGTDDDRKLLWALRGGGGFSYGIVTELVIQTFPLPKNTIKFHVVWSNSPAMKVLEVWEDLIAPNNNKELIGTNLKIMAKPYDGQAVEKSIHECTFYGYFSGSLLELETCIKKWFSSFDPSDYVVTIDSKIDSKTLQNAPLSFSSWDRISKADVWSKLTRLEKLGKLKDLQKDKLKSLNKSFTSKSLKTIPPDVDPPAPHKITSRVVNEQGLGKEGRIRLIKSLESDLLHPEGELADIHCYVTLGAISGSFYRDYKPDAIGSAFPYKKRPYFIQYQAWWNDSPEAIAKGNLYHEYRFTNQAQDWIEVSRQNNFPETRGAFISFKDSAVPTKDYFLESFNELRDIKLKYSNDPDNKFRTRKTII